MSDAPAKRCSFLKTGPERCSEEATDLVEHRYGMGWYCEEHADWVVNKWRPAPEETSDLIVLEHRRGLAPRAPSSASFFG